MKSAMRLKSRYRSPKLCELGKGRGVNTHVNKNGKTGLTETDVEERTPSL